MIDAELLLSELKVGLDELLDDLQVRVEAVPEMGDRLQGEYQRAFDAERTGWTFTEWVEDRLTQVAVGWLLACVFVRYCEDNGLLDDPMISGSGDAVGLVRATQRDYFRANPADSDREYLQHVFRSAAAHRGLDGVLGEGRSPLWLADPSADACTSLIERFRRVDDDGDLVLDFTDADGDTRFLGDLYQDLSEHAKKTYALLQTPDFVEEFILDRTLDPAIEAFGLSKVSVIDPTCGSGHFLLGSFERLWERWAEAEPAMPAEERAAKALDAVWGVDINPFAAAIARFRLLIAAMARVGQTRLADARDYPIHVAVGDSLLWGASQQSLPTLEDVGGVEHQFLYATEDADALRETFSHRFAAVVGNPPYIVPKDKAANAAYRGTWDSCRGKYSLGVPFTELFFDLAHAADSASARSAGFVGVITANSFMKREMGKKLIEEFIPTWDLTHVVDTSGAYIPGHGTPTVILFGRNQKPVADTIRAVQGIRGEPSTPATPSEGLVWTAILDQIDEAGSESEYISVDDVDRARFAKHPWSIGGGGAAELKETLDSGSLSVLQEEIESIGFGAITGEDELFLDWGSASIKRSRLTPVGGRKLVSGEVLRDWEMTGATYALFPYSDDGSYEEHEDFLNLAWRFRTNLEAGLMFGKTRSERGLNWGEYVSLSTSRIRSRLLIAFASVSTHNHFALDRGGKVFKQTAPVIKLREDATFDEHLGLLALLNSSTACFWMQQVFHNKGGPGGGSSKDEKWRDFYDFDGTKLKSFPLPAVTPPAERGHIIDELAQELAANQPSALVADSVMSRDALDWACTESERIFARMVSEQEELDWHCLSLYGITDGALTAPDGASAPPLVLGERAFEIVLARKVAAEQFDTRWFADFGGSPIIEPPAHWPDWYRDLVERRISLIESDRNVGLVERPENKRRWARDSWEDLEQVALRGWLLDRLEDRSLWFDGAQAVVRSVAQLADRVVADEEWMSVARLYEDRVEVDPLALVTSLIADEHVPAQAAARYKPSGRRKRVEWERTWELQRAEDRGEDVGRIAVPPRYTSTDFAKTSYWRQRGKLDVPKERFVSIAGAELDASAGDSTIVLAWAGFDDAELAQAIGTLLHRRQMQDGWNDERLLPLIAALDEVLSWVAQWHPEVDPGLGQPLAGFYQAMIDQSLASIGATIDDARAWTPPPTRRGRKAAAKKAAATKTPTENQR